MLRIYSFYFTAGKIFRCSGQNGFSCKWVLLSAVGYGKIKLYDPFYNKKNEEKERIGSNHEKYKKAAGCSAGRAAVRICDGLCKQQLFKHGGRNVGDVFHGERGRDRGEHRQGPCGL